MLSLRNSIYPMIVAAMLFQQMQAISDNFSVKFLARMDVQGTLRFVSEQRLTAFSEYPYLYKGTPERENEYFSWFTQLPSSAIAVAYLEEKPVGFITCASFSDYSEIFQGAIAQFKELGLDPYSYFYISEVIILPEYRGNRLSRKLFEVIENHAKKSGFKACCFVTESHDVHPQQPKDYKSLTPLWNKLGYRKSLLFSTFTWLTIQINGSAVDQVHKLDYWLKDFEMHKSEL